MIKKILIVSDSHGRSQNIRIAIERECPDMLIHLGDIEDDPEDIRKWLDAAAARWNDKNESEKKSLPIPAVFVRGNCDRYGGDSLKQAAVFEVNEHRFFCTHGHRQNVNYGMENLMYTAMENDCDIALFGHTHVPFDEVYDDPSSAGSQLRIMNPGSITLPRGGRRKSYMLMEFDDENNYEGQLKEL